jgi:drug/metabolite transporter (DMT)-like permease
VALGIVYAGGQLLQTWGLQHTSASVSGFVTGMYVVLTPLLGALILRHSIGSSVWAAAFLATGGLGVLSLQGLAIGVGEAVTLLSAGFYALHILGLGAWSAGRDAMGLAVVQMVTVALVCFVAWLPGGIVLPSTGGYSTALFYMPLVAGAFAIVGQTWGQAHLPAARAAVIMTMEPVWAGGFAVAFGGEGVTTRLLLGGALVLAAMFLAEFGPRRKEDQDVAREIGGVPHVGPV